ncbi:MAG: DUF11 domain-containing protein [Planctomycetales bacterium]|nr:DUF11 domain-containing protein [Planctomycetales bacterium]
MNSPRNTRWLPLAIAGLLVGVVGSGCASLPRIDPSGNRLLVWPKDQPQTAVVTNPTAPPVLSDPNYPSSTAPVLTSPPPGMPGVGPIATGPQATSASLVSAPRDILTITPDRILAPVGSEVVLKSSICSEEGYTLADQKIEWMLGRNGVGQFVELGGKGIMHPAWLPWNKPKKIDNYYAVGYTASGPLCVTRGTDDPNDDVEITRGDAWVSVHSPVEGTSYVTSYAAQVPGWGDRRATAVIYWVDVQWVFPPATVASSGRPETLTTTVTRQTDGTPIEGWIVRYEVDDGGSGGSAAQVADVRTGADGRATVEVSPTASGASSSLIRTKLIRPARFGGGDEPELVIANGASRIDWTGEAPYVPSDGGVFTSPPGSSSPITPTTPTTPGGASPIPNIPPAPARKPRLEVEIFRTDQNPVQVGGQVRFEVVVRNLGDAVATNVRVNDKFTPGLSHLSDVDNAREINSDDIGPIEPGGSKSLFLTFDVTQPGELAHDVTVSCAEGSTAAARAPVTARPAPQQARPGLEVKKVGPVQAIVGETKVFTITVKNTGETPLTNVTVYDEYPATLRATPPAGAELVQGALRWVIPRMAPGDVQRFDVDVYCVTQTQQAKTYVEATVQTETGAGTIRTAAEHTIEILPSAGAPPAAGGAAAPAATGPLRIRVEPNDTTVRATTKTIIQVRVQNAAETPDQQISVRVVFPPELTPDLNSLQGPPGVRPTVSQNAIIFTPIAEARPGEIFNYQIPVMANRPGVVQVVAEAVSARVPSPVQHAATVEIRSP